MLSDQSPVERLGCNALRATSCNVRGCRCATSQDRGRLRQVRRLVAIAVLLTVAMLSGGLSGCGDTKPRSARFGTYVSRLCEAIGPFEVDAQRFGRIISRHGLDVKSRNSELTMTNILTAVIVDAHHVVTTLEAVGAPDVDHGRTLAASIVATFEQVEKGDALWRSELDAGDWTWPTASRANRESLRASIQALVLVGRQVERLPFTQERQDAMARSPVCRHLFGSVRVGAVVAPTRVTSGQ